MLPTTVLINQHWRRNRLAFLADYLGFGVGLVFANAATTLPAFAAVLTTNKIVIGAISALWAGGWLLPQIFAAHYLTGQPRKYPIMMKWQFIGRPALLLFVLWLLFGGVRYPVLTLALFLLALMLFRVTDALVALAYWDIFGRAVPVDRRGRLFGIGQVATGLAAVGASVIIQQVLGPRGPGFPLNYAAVFGLACVFFAVSTIGTALLVEIPEAAGEAAPPPTSLRAFLPQLVRLWRADPRFSRITLVRVLTGLGALATTFYVVYATDVLHLPPAAIGLFAGAATAGAVLAGLLLGPVADRLGAHRVVQAVTWAQFLVPVIALLCHLGVFGAAVNVIYPLLYVLLGVFEGSFMLGFNNFILSIAPPGQRPAYMGLTNTFAGLLIVVPLIGGYLLEVTSYPVLFIAAAIGTLAAALLALRLPHPGQSLPAAVPSRRNPARRRALALPNRLARHFPSDWRTASAIILTGLGVLPWPICVPEIEAVLVPLSALVNQHWRRNWVAFMTDYLGFDVVLIFANATTTLPAFAALLTDNKVLIGAVSSLWTGGWLLPQIFAAHYLSDKPRKYPIMMKGELLGRPAFVLFVVWLLLGGARYPQLTIALCLIAILIFRASDALVALAYWDVIAKAVPADRRGRLFGLGQVITGVVAVGASLIIQRVLSPDGPAFPLNYALLFGLACVGLVLSTVGSALLVELPEAAPAAPATSLRAFLPQLGRVWRADPRFSRITLVRMLSGLSGLATGFYVIYATDMLHLPAAAVGLFAGAATVGAVLAGLLLGPVADRFGAHRVVQAVTWANFLVPLLAWLCHVGVFGAAVKVVYPLLYVLLGVFEGSFTLGFTSFILEISPPGQRPAYLGLTNTVAGLLIVVPLLGGYLLERTSYPVLFVAAAIGTLSAALLALGLTHPGRSSAVTAPAAAP